MMFPFSKCLMKVSRVLHNKFSVFFDEDGKMFQGCVKGVLRNFKEVVVTVRESVYTED